MFTWICQECGQAVDLAEDACPACQTRREEGDEATVEQKPEAPRSPARPAYFHFRTVHLLLFLFFLLAAGGGAVYLANPEVFALERLEGLFGGRPQPLPAEPYAGALEVTGVRAWIDEEEGPLARAIVVNHGEMPRRNVELLVRLLPPETAEDPAALGEFSLFVEQEIGPLESREVQGAIELREGVEALPYWQELRVAVELK